MLVTGASRGIGAALLAALREAGAAAIGAARTTGPGIFRCDVANAEEVAALRREVGPVDVLINNAAVIHRPAPLLALPLDEWRRLFDTNLFGLLHVLHAFVPDLVARGDGWVINLSSTWGRVAAGRQAPYCATKFAVEALSASLAAELSPGVAVLAVNPGVVATEMLATCFEGDVSGATPPAECAAAFVKMLEAADASWSGRSLDVDSFR